MENDYRVVTVPEDFAAARESLKISDEMASYRTDHKRFASAVPSPYGN